ncbi:MAG: tetratricopeptide repeat protein, partial [Candidatus Baltobacteraceae bacterium]
MGRSPFGLALRRLRLAAGLSQEDLAERARLSAESVSALERGARKAPYRETVRMLAEALRLSDSELHELQRLARPARRVAAADPEPKASSSDGRAHHYLPAPRTPLRGRERALETMSRLLSEHRLVTIAGSGGVGKTRVAIAAAAALLDTRTFETVWFVELASLASDDLVEGAVAKVLCDDSNSGESLLDVLTRRVQGTCGLLIVDNCEHVVKGARAAVAAVLAACPNVRILTTSRQPLQADGERHYRLPSLDVPESRAGLTADNALRYGAVALFVDSAIAANEEFVLTDDNAPLVADICARLDGIALTLELAAARTNVLSIRSLARHLDERFRLLTGGNPRALPRQRTLSALIDWSYDLLSPQERRLFNRFAIFAGGFGLEAAHVVCADESDDLFAVLDVLSSLVDKSLVVAYTTGTLERYRLLESTRAYALDRLEAVGELDGIARRHARFFAGLATDADRRFGLEPTNGWLAALEPEAANFRRALDWALDGGHAVVTGGTIAGALERFWVNGGLEAEGRRWTMSALEHVSETEQPFVAARLWRARAWLATATAKRDAAEHAAALYERTGDRTGLGDSLRLLALGSVQMGRVAEAVEFNDRALAIFRALEDKRNVANCLDMAASIAGAGGDWTTARGIYNEALALFRDMANDGGIASVLVGLAYADYFDGNPESALVRVREAYEIHRARKYATNLAIDNLLIAVFLLALGDDADVSEHAETALRWAQTANNPSLVANAISCLALLRAKRGDVRRAARLAGYMVATFASLGQALDPVEQDVADWVTAALEAQLTRPQIALLEAEGAAWTQDRAVLE